MNDKELLELAAKADGHMVEFDNELMLTYGKYCGTKFLWNPLYNDGDAFRLAVKLGIVIDANDDCIHIQYVINGIAKPITVHEYDDVYVATRRAIVLAAAEIAKTKGE